MSLPPPPSGHEMKECTGEAKEKEGEFNEMANSGGMAQKDLIFIRLPVLREVSLASVCVCVCAGKNLTGLA